VKYEGKTRPELAGQGRMLQTVDGGIDSRARRIRRGSGGGAWRRWHAMEDTR
jgi:hypothetical protein